MFESWQNGRRTTLERKMAEVRSMMEEVKELRAETEEVLAEAKSLQAENRRMQVLFRASIPRIKALVQAWRDHVELPEMQDAPWAWPTLRRVHQALWDLQTALMLEEDNPPDKRDQGETPYGDEDEPDGS